MSRDDVIAVGAADTLGDPIMWSHGERFYADRPWWDVTAPGIDLISASVRRGRTAHGGSALVRLVICRGGSNRGISRRAIRSLSIAYSNVSNLTYLGVRTTP